MSLQEQHQFLKRKFQHSSASRRPSISTTPGPAFTPSSNTIRSSISSSKTNTKLTVAATTTASKDYPYPVDYCDHFETSLEAYQDIDPILQAVAQALGHRDKRELKIYDPYYCQGATIGLLCGLGYSRSNIFHRKRDFYKDIENKNIPDYDVLVTNPPYSELHKEKCLSFCENSNKPYLLLLPNYIATKQYFLSSPHVQEIHYLAPPDRYQYQHPEGTGHAASPFFSLWFICFSTLSSQVQVSHPHLFHLPPTVPSKILHHPPHHPKRKSLASVPIHRWGRLLSLKELREQKLVPTQKRPSSKQRQRMKKKKAREDGADR